MKNEKIFFKNPNRPAIILKDSTGKKTVLSNTHMHPELEFLYVFSGEVAVTIEDKVNLIVSQDDIVFVNSNIPHSTKTLKKNTSTGLIQFRNPSFFKNELKYLSHFLAQSNTAYFVFKSSDSDYAELKETIFKMINSGKVSGVSHDYYITASIYTLLAILHNKKFIASEENFVDLKLISKLIPVFRYIHEHYDENLTLDVISSQIGLNKDYFCRLFKKATKTTLTDYLNFVRVTKAEELLKTNMSMSEISYSVGFSSSSYFNQIFKKYKQYPPLTYRKLYSVKSNQRP